MHGTAGRTTPLARVGGVVALVRPKQWIKNGFVFAPLVFTGLFADPASVLRTVAAAVVFSLAASAVYVFNDIRDVERDRCHPKKSRSRPLASGAVSMGSAWVVLGLLLAAVAASGFALVPRAMPAVGAYLALNVAYTLYLKHQPVLDIFTIAIGFVLRVYAGPMALSVPVSSWMFITTLCLALYLAAIKRRQELRGSGSEGRRVLESYSVPLVERYAEISATGALVFYSMFVMSAKPELVVTIPFVLFGLFRYWYVVEKLDGGESPTDALFTDWQLLVTVALWVLASAAAVLHA